MAQPNPPSKTEQLANTGKKAAEKVTEMASNAGSKIKEIFAKQCIYCKTKIWICR